MQPSVAALIAAALLAAVPAASAGADAPAPSGLASERLASLDAEALARLPAGELQELLEAALSPPPKVVVRDTKYYGTVTIDHAAHLSRRNPCKACHGPGPVTKIKFTAKLAHERCVGCHQTMAKGPDKCQGCHVQPPPPPVELAADEARPQAPPGPPPPNPENVAAALAAVDSSTNPASRIFQRDPYQRYLEVGYAGGPGHGFSVRLASHESNFVVTQSIDYLGARNDSRTFTMFGAGLSRLGRGRISFEAVGLAGADVVSAPGVGVLPAIGLRGGAEFRPDHGFIQRVCASVTGIADLSQRASGRDVGGFTVYGTLATGFRVP